MNTEKKSRVEKLYKSFSNIFQQDGKNLFFYKQNKTSNKKY